MGTLNRKIELLEQEYEKQQKKLDSLDSELQKKTFESTLLQEKQNSFKNSKENKSEAELRMSEIKDQERKNEIIEEIYSLQKDIQQFEIEKVSERQGIERELDFLEKENKEYQEKLNLVELRKILDEKNREEGDSLYVNKSEDELSMGSDIN